ncbi:ATP-binding protein [Nocardioides cavernaquae]|uniref:ATP-binding protein n=1 Tax=Nocardioides cavernaquae TaxID=2321396 RepID=A0A3A5H3B1_9ACTN|nr:ATP-binding protein [Nocardioides cavernaquae]RJS45266.1 ATP-binding protein [Nocardioides cavernaquae]
MDLILAGDMPLASAAFLSGQDPDRLVIDATALAFACPLDLAGIVAWAHWASSHSLPVTLNLPHDQATAAYLQRMDVLRHLPSRSRIVGRLPPDTRNDQTGSLLEVTALNPGNVDDLSERLGPLVMGFYGEDTEAGAAVLRACGELISNAAEHGPSERGAFMAAQLHTGTTTDGTRLEFAVCDTGIGVMNHLRQNPKYAHYTQDKYAIARATKAGVTGVTGGRNDKRGNGLWDVVTDARKFGEASLQIRSGKGEVRVHGTPDMLKLTSSDRPDQTAGTWAWLTHRLSPASKTMIQSRK